MAYIPGAFDFSALQPASGYGYSAAYPDASYLTSTYGQKFADYVNPLWEQLQSSYVAPPSMGEFDYGYNPNLSAGTPLSIGGGTLQNQLGTGGGWRISPEAASSIFSSIGGAGDPQVQQYLNWLSGQQQQANAWDESYVSNNQSGLSKFMGVAMPAIVGGMFGAGALGMLGPAAAGMAPAFGGLAGVPGATVGGELALAGAGAAGAGAGAGGAADASWGVNPRGSGMFDLGGWENYGIYGGGGPADYSWVEGLGSAFGDSFGSTFPDYINFSEAYNPMTALLGDLGISGMPSGGNLLGSLFGGGGGQQGGGGLLGGLFGGGNNALLGALLGGALGGLGGDRQSGTIDVTNTPWGPQQPYLTQGFQSAANTLGQAQPSQVTGPAEQQLLSTIQGDYLNPETNPYLQQTYDIASAQLTPQIESYYAKYGRQGSNAAGNALGNAYAGLANQIYGGNYQQERSRQAAGILGAPGFAQQGYDALFAPTSNYMQAIRGNYGNTQSTPYFTNPYANILGGALTGAQLGGLF